jgi:hypothetical protein
MVKLSSAVAASALAIASAGVSAANVSTPVTFSDLVWFTTFNAPGLTSCDELVFDATGNLDVSDKLVIYGALNCSAGAYGMTGSVYTGSDGSLNITMLTAGYTISCPSIFGYAGNCTVYDASFGVRGTGRIELR